MSRHRFKNGVFPKTPLAQFHSSSPFPANEDFSQNADELPSYARQQRSQLEAFVLANFEARQGDVSEPGALSKQTRMTAYPVAGCLSSAMIEAEELRERQWSSSAGQNLPGDYVRLLYFSTSLRTAPGTFCVRVRTS